MKGILITVIFFQAILGGMCSRVPPLPDGEISDVELATLRDEVRSIMRPGCGSCHTSTLRTAKPGAVAAFDFINDDWSGRMTPEHLEGLAVRLDDLGDSLRAKVHLLVAAEISRKSEHARDGS